MYQSGLVPRVIPLMGLIGGALLATAIIATLLSLIVQTNPLAGLTALPVALWEFSLGVYLVVKGSKPCPITDAMVAACTTPAQRNVVA
jgi:hypothetical protein